MLFRSQAASAVADLIEVEGDDRADKCAHCDFAVATREHPKRGDYGDARVSFHKSNLRFEQLHSLPKSGNGAHLSFHGRLPGSVGLEALKGAVTEPAWRRRPSYYFVAEDDGMIPPAAQRMMANRAGSSVTEAPGSHAIYISNPEVVAAVIRQAAQ